MNIMYWWALCTVARLCDCVAKFILIEAFPSVRWLVGTLICYNVMKARRHVKCAVTSTSLIPLHCIPLLPIPT